MQIRHFFLFLLTLCVFQLQAQEKRPMTPLDVAKIQYVGSADFSDDGKYIAYTLRIQADPLKENKAAHYELHVYDVEAGKSYPFITRGSVSSVEFRPGHGSITFRNRLEGDKVTGLYEIPLRGGEAQLLYQHETSIGSYAWSPDGKTLAFVASEKKEKSDSGLPYEPKVYEGELSYDHVYLIKPGMGETRMITSDRHAESVVWSPRGDKLAIAYAKSPLVDDHYMEQHLYITSADGKGGMKMVEHSGKQGEFCFSPDGSMLAFIAGADKNDPTAGRLFVVSSEGGTPKQLNAGWNGMYEEIEWLNQDYIHFLGSQGTESVTGYISPDAKKHPKMMEEHTGLAINSFDAIPDGSVSYVAEKWNHPPELFVALNEERSMKKLTDSNPWIADSIALAKQEVIRYKARDGLEIEGILIHPLNKKEGTKYPLITYVHGGPESHLDNGWMTGYSTPGQVAAGMGYAVFYPNYRGSTGRGLEYTLSSQSDPAGKELDDVVDGVDYLIGMSLVDMDRVGVTGGSYGGYATGWFATRYSERFAAGVMFVGISNIVSKWGTTDIPNEEYLVHARKWVYEDYDFFLKRSPVYYAGECETPLLIMHGEEDTRVHPSQSMELYRHIKSRTDTPVELVFYPGEGHGNAKATARYDYNTRMLGWFEKYLKEPKS